jgi:VCBS repeat-containing protein
VNAVFSGLPAVQFSASATSDVPTTIELVSGNNQSAPVGSAVPNPLVVRVTDANDNPVANVGVAWTANGGGSVSDDNTATDANGLAQVTRTLGLVPGPYTTTAAVDGLSGSPITFTSTATVGPPAQLAITQHPVGSTTSGAPFAPVFVIQVQDALGNAVADGGVEITASITSGQTASLVGTNPRNTNGSGRATFTGLGISGPPDDDYVITFSTTGGESYTPVSSLPLTVTTGAATKIVIIQQPSADAQSGDAFGQQPGVQIQDASGNPISGNRTVTAVLDQGAGNGALTGTLTASTGVGSTATFTNLGIAGVTGSYTIVFTSGTLDPAESITIAITNNPPTADDEAYSVDEDDVLTVPAGSGVLVGDSDPDGDNLTAVNASDPANGTVVLQTNGSFVYTPDPDFNETDTFTYQADDGRGNTSSATVTITVDPVNDAPSFNAGGDVIASVAVPFVNGWATQILPGPSDEISQTVTFEVQLSSADSLSFLVLPTIDETGTLSFTALLPGIVSATVVATDNGLGNPSSVPQDFTITINP